MHSIGVTNVKLIKWESVTQHKQGLILSLSPPVCVYVCVCLMSVFGSVHNQEATYINMIDKVQLCRSFAFCENARLYVPIVTAL